MCVLGRWWWWRWRAEISAHSRRQWSEKGEASGEVAGRGSPWGTQGRKVVALGDGGGEVEADWVADSIQAEQEHGG